LFSLKDKRLKPILRGLSKALKPGFGLLLVALANSTAAENSASQSFIAQAFSEPDIATMKTLWLTGEIKTEIKDKFGYDAPQLRLRYWQLGARTAWILDEIGKERPITIGVVVDSARIDTVDILAYRESRGGEVQQRFFTEQFAQAALLPTGETFKLDRTINGITGATLSVRAVRKIATLALFLDRKVQQR